MIRGVNLLINFRQSILFYYRLSSPEGSLRAVWLRVGLALDNYVGVKITFEIKKALGHPEVVSKLA